MTCNPEWQDVWYYITALFDWVWNLKWIHYSRLNCLRRHPLVFRLPRHPRKVGGLRLSRSLYPYLYGLHDLLANLRENRSKSWLVILLILVFKLESSLVPYSLRTSWSQSLSYLVHSAVSFHSEYMTSAVKEWGVRDFSRMVCLRDTDMSSGSWDHTINGRVAYRLPCCRVSKEDKQWSKDQGPDSFINSSTHSSVSSASATFTNGPASDLLKDKYQVTRNLSD